jgi:hypothetical protein
VPNSLKLSRAFFRASKEKVLDGSEYLAEKTEGTRERGAGARGALREWKWESGSGNGTANSGKERGIALVQLLLTRELTCPHSALTRQ